MLKWYKTTKPGYDGCLLKTVSLCLASVRDGRDRANTVPGGCKNEGHIISAFLVLGICRITLKTYIFYQARVHYAFQVQDQDQAQVSKWIISGLFPIICSRKLDLCKHWYGKCCFRSNMHKIKEHVGDN